MEAGPKTLLEAVQYFADEDNCIKYLAAKRWPDGVAICPTCGKKGAGFLATQKRWQCSNRHPKRQFSIKVGTILEDSPIGLDKWLPAMWLICSSRNGISSWELHRALKVTQKTAWFMLQRIRLAMQDENTGGKLGGEGVEVEIDETYIGGKSRNMHASKKLGRGTGFKETVFGVIERGGKVRALHINGKGKPELQGHVRNHVLAGTAIFTDELSAYEGLSPEFKHEVINHAVAYVNGNVHTNTMENFWALLKRNLKGTYISVEPWHLFRYLDEQCFRFNNRLPMKDGDRFGYLVRKIVGKRLTYAELIGKSGERQAEAF